MARRVRKTYKQRQKELETPEVVEETLWNLSDWMEANWRTVVGALAAVTAIWAAVGLFQIISTSSERSKAEATAGVFKAFAQPIYAKPAGLEGDDPNKPLGESYPDRKARADAVMAAATSAEKDETAPLIGVLEAAAKAQAGDSAGQLSGLDAAMQAAGDGPLAAALLEQKASALAAAGKGAEAAVAWDKVAGSAKTRFGKAHALIRVGDLYNARTGATKPDAAKAKAAYSGAIAALKDKEKAPEKGPLAFLNAEAQTKLAGL